MQYTKSEKWCVLIILDVRNSFNSANWILIVEELEWRGIAKYLLNVISYYFSHKQVVSEVERGVLVGIGSGVPQGSLLGSIL